MKSYEVFFEYSSPAFDSINIEMPDDSTKTEAENEAFNLIPMSWPEATDIVITDCKEVI